MSSHDITRGHMTSHDVPPQHIVWNTAVLYCVLGAYGRWLLKGRNSRAVEREWTSKYRAYIHMVGGPNDCHMTYHMTILQDACVVWYH